MNNKPNCWIFGELGLFDSRPNKYTVAVFATSATDARNEVKARYGSGSLIKAQRPHESEHRVTFAIVTDKQQEANRARLQDMLEDK